MNCEKVSELLDFYLEKELSGDLVRQIDDHLSSCTQCSNELNGYARLYSVMEKIEDNDELPENFTAMVMEKLPRGENRFSFHALSDLVKRFFLPLSSVAVVLVLVLSMFLIQTEKTVRNPVVAAADQAGEQAVQKKEEPGLGMTGTVLTQGPFQIIRQGLALQKPENFLDALIPGDRVVTGESKLEFKSGNRTLLVGRNTDLSLSSDRIDLNSGIIRARIEKNGEAFSVKTPNCTIHVTGTDFIAVHKQMQETLVSLITGSLKVSNQSNTVTIESGQKATVSNPFDNILVEVLKQNKAITPGKKDPKVSPSNPETPEDKKTDSQHKPSEDPDTYNDFYDQFETSNQSAGSRIR